MRKLLDAVRGLLIHDMDEKAFADMYAQTVAYGLLSARFSRPAGLTAQNLVQLTAVSNPFLENLLESLFRLNRGKFHFDVDEIGINDVLDLLRRTNIEAIKAAFNDQNPAEDPVIRFYEGFLKEYDPQAAHPARDLFHSAAGCVLHRPQRPRAASDRVRSRRWVGVHRHVGRCSSRNFQT